MTKHKLRDEVAFWLLIVAITFMIFWAPVKGAETVWVPQDWRLN
jgi:hypothetical protein